MHGVPQEDARSSYDPPATSRRTNTLTSHPSDDARFFKFVRAIWNTTNTLIDEPSLREQIAKRATEFHSTFNSGRMSREIGARVNQIQEFMDYHLANGD